MLSSSAHLPRLHSHIDQQAHVSVYLARSSSLHASCLLQPDLGLARPSLDHSSHRTYYSRSTSLQNLRYTATSRTTRSQITSLRKGLAGEDHSPSKEMLNERKKYISDSIRGVPDFPIKGINFHDVTTMLLDPVAFRYSIQDFAERYRNKSIDAIAGERILLTIVTTCEYRTSPCAYKTSPSEHACKLL